MIIMDLSIIKPQVLLDQAPLPHDLIPSSGHEKPAIRGDQNMLDPLTMNLAKVMGGDSFLNIPLFQFTVLASSELKDAVVGQGHAFDAVLMGLFIFFVQFISLYHPLLKILIITASK